MKILITGFEPFGAEKTNPAWEAVSRLPEYIGKAKVEKALLPVSFEKAGKALTVLMDNHHPDAVVCVGQAGGRSAVTVEKVAINLIDASIPDNDGLQPIGQSVREGRPAAYFTKMPVREIVLKIREAGIPCFVSYSAGTFVCNSVMYELLDEIEKRSEPVLGGFIHVPYSVSQTIDKPNGTAGMEIPTIARGLEEALKVIAEEIEKPETEKQTERGKQDFITGEIC